MLPTLTDAQAIIQAIREEPDEQVHRLAYADLLDEQGDAERAEFIRLQLKLFSSGPSWAGTRDAERHRSLLRKNARNWLPGFPGQLDRYELANRPFADGRRLVTVHVWLSRWRGSSDRMWWFDRGFIYGVRLPFDTLEAERSRLWELAPALTLVITLEHAKPVRLMDGRWMWVRFYGQRFFANEKMVWRPERGVLRSDLFDLLPFGIEPEDARSSMRLYASEGAARNAFHDACFAWAVGGPVSRTAECPP